MHLWFIKIHLKLEDFTAFRILSVRQTNEKDVAFFWTLKNLKIWEKKSALTD